MHFFKDDKKTKKEKKQRDRNSDYAVEQAAIQGGGQVSIMTGVIIGDEAVVNGNINGSSSKNSAPQVSITKGIKVRIFLTKASENNVSRLVKTDDSIETSERPQKAPVLKMIKLEIQRNTLNTLLENFLYFLLTLNRMKNLQKFGLERKKNFASSKKLSTKFWRKAARK